MGHSNCIVVFGGLLQAILTTGQSPPPRPLRVVRRRGECYETVCLTDTSMYSVISSTEEED
uniref:Uncharacterized protein n=1 Tax=Setaria viridis TaxID=4556 RepID=A0A4U6U4N5_SETVI|nr:hypothetical protein SEVIR_6G085250v2 [Setaria viridis]